MSLTTVINRISIAAAAALAATVLPATAGAHTNAASDGLKVVLSTPGGSTVAEESPDGYARFARDGSNRLLGGYIVSYRRLTLTMLDGKLRSYQELPLDAAVKQLRQAREAMLAGSVEAPGDPGKLPETNGVLGSETRVVAGRKASLLNLTLAGTSYRDWYVAAPAPPPEAVTSALKLLDTGTGDALPPGALIVRAEEQVGKDWRAAASAKSVATGAIPASDFDPPKGWQPGSVTNASRRRPMSVPANVGRTHIPFIPSVQLHQRVFALYWGSRFTREPATVAALNASFGVIERNPFVGSLSQYDGIGQGSFAGSRILAGSPPAALGNADVTGIASATGPVNGALFAPGAPGLWSRWDTTTQPLYVIFVTSGTVTVDGNDGYHAAVPVPTAFIDPLGLFVLPAVPYTVVKVPSGHVGRTDLDAGTVTLSHETVETASDPFGIGGWRQISPPAGEQGELADICQEGNAASLQKSRVAGVAVNTYWSQRENSCVPSPLPTVTIDRPSRDATLPWGAPILLRARATDPFDGPLFENSLTWQIVTPPSARRAVTPTSLHLVAPLPAGTYFILADARNSQRGDNVGSTRFTVAPPSGFQVEINSPADGAAIADAYTSPVPFSATAAGASGVTFSWRDDVDGVLPTGQSFSHVLSGGPDFQRTHHVTVTAAAPPFRPVTRTVTVFSGTP